MTPILKTVLAAAMLLAGRMAGGQELYPIVKGRQWGFMDKAGEVVVTPRYTCAWDFSEGLACVQVGLLRGYVDTNGNMTVPPSYFLACPFSEGLAAVYRDAERWGHFMIFNGGSGRWVYIDKTGRVAIDPKVRLDAFAGEFHEGMARVAYGAQQGLLTTNGTLVVTGGVASVYAGGCSEGMAAFQRAGGKFGFVDTNGQCVIQAHYEDAGDFSEGLARVRTGTMWQFIDRTGKQAFEGRFDDARDFAGGLAAVRVAPPDGAAAKTRPPKGQWGCIDKAGKIVIEAKYEFVGPLSEERARVVVASPSSTNAARTLHGYIDASGAMVIQPVYDCGWEFSKGLARVRVGDTEGYIDKTGRYVWEPSF